MPNFGSYKQFFPSMYISFFESCAHIDWLFKSAHINIATPFFSTLPCVVILCTIYFKRAKHTNSILSGHPFFSYLHRFITDLGCLFSRIIFPVMSHNFILSKVAFLCYFPCNVQWLRLTRYDPLDDSVYVPRLCLVWFDSIFSCSSMDFCFSLTSVVQFIFVTSNTRIYVEPWSLFRGIFPCNLQRLATNPACFSALPCPCNVPR